MTPKGGNYIHVTLSFIAHSANKNNKSKAIPVTGRGGP
jgi:hypothetical protein